jgi:hypothetical protein
VPESKSRPWLGNSQSSPDKDLWVDFYSCIGKRSGAGRKIGLEGQGRSVRGRWGMESISFCRDVLDSHLGHQPVGKGRTALFGL